MNEIVQEQILRDFPRMLPIKISIPEIRLSVIILGLLDYAPFAVICITGNKTVIDPSLRIIVVTGRPEALPIIRTRGNKFPIPIFQSLF